MARRVAAVLALVASVAAEQASAAVPKLQPVRLERSAEPLGGPTATAAAAKQTLPQATNSTDPAGGPAVATDAPATEPNASAAASTVVPNHGAHAPANTTGTPDAAEQPATLPAAVAALGPEWAQNATAKSSAAAAESVEAAELPRDAAAMQAISEAAAEEADGEHEGAHPELHDPTELCHAWAEAGECIRNPQYMFSACKQECDSQVYVDGDVDCGGWATNGECEANPLFMYERCNASCIRVAKESMNHPDSAVRKNPHLTDFMYDSGDEGSHRAATFVPIFLAVAALLAVGSGLVLMFGDALAAQQDAALERVEREKMRLQRQYPRLAPLLKSATVSGAGAALICCYYVNEGLTVVQTHPLISWAFSFLFNTDGVWHQHVPWVDAFNLAGAVAAVLRLLNVQPMRCACVMMGDTLVDSYLLLWRISYQWLYGRGLYINELMAKKFSLLGCVAMMIASSVQASAKSSSFPGLLMESAELSTRLSVAMLIGRLLIAVLFLYVGLTELNRLLFEVTQPSRAAATQPPRHRHATATQPPRSRHATATQPPRHHHAATQPPRQRHAGTTQPPRNRHATARRRNATVTPPPCHRHATATPPPRHRHATVTPPSRRLRRGTARAQLAAPTATEACHRKRRPQAPPKPAAPSAAPVAALAVRGSTRTRPRSRACHHVRRSHPAQPFTPYLPGDGHDVVWPKAVELLLSVPFILGFRTAAVSRLLASSLIVEAFYAWSWWAIPGAENTFAHHRRAIHYREHFATNVATAGGLLLLQKIGAGKYTVDELLKKKD